MEAQVVQKNKIEDKKQTIDKSIRICVNCGSISVKIQNYGVFCKNCGIFFDVERVNN